MKPSFFAVPALMLTAIAFPAAPTYHRDIPAKLAADAKISENEAVATALGAVFNGEVLSVELENEKGKFLYSVDIKTPEKSGVEEIHISALDGHLLSRQQESAKTERKEHAAEKKEAGQ